MVATSDLSRHRRSTHTAASEDTDMNTAISQETSNIELTEREEAWVRIVGEKVRALRFGTVHIKVHEAQVVLVESTEQTRFDLLRKPNT